MCAAIGVSARLSAAVFSAAVERRGAAIVSSGNVSADLFGEFFDPVLRGVAELYALIDEVLQPSNTKIVHPRAV